MIKEGPPSFENSHRFEVGELVMLRPDLAKEIIDALQPQVLPDTIYKIFHISEHPDEDVVTAYLGPEDLELSEQEMDAEALLVDRSDIYPVSVEHLAKVTIH